MLTSTANARIAPTRSERCFHRCPLCRLLGCRRQRGCSVLTRRAYPGGPTNQASCPAMSVRTLVSVRHAKAERPDGVADIERTLTERGHADAAAIGAWLAHHDMRPDLVICSPAKRTRQTWHGIAVALADAPEVHYEPAAYDGGARDLLDLIQGVDDGMTDGPGRRPQPVGVDAVRAARPGRGRRLRRAADQRRRRAPLRRRVVGVCRGRGSSWWRRTPPAADPAAGTTATTPATGGIAWSPRRGVSAWAAVAAEAAGGSAPAGGRCAPLR